MMRYGALAALVAAVAAVAAAAPSAAAVELNGWYPCELAGGPREDAQCAVFRAPLCYADADDTRCGGSALSTRALDVFVKRLAPGGPTPTTPNVVVVQSGPGAQSLDIEAAMRSIARALGGAVDVYSLDRRGAGRSTKLDCVAAQAQTASSLGGVAISPEEVASCADELASKYARDLSVFSLTSAARDVQYFVENMLNGSGPTFVYGAGAHSAIVERLIHVDARANGSSNSIRGFILDGVATTSGAAPDAFPFESKWDEAYDAVGQQFLALCASDADNCGRYFSGATATASDALRAIEKNLAASASVCATALDGQLANVFDYKPGQYPPAQAFRWAMGELLRRATLRKLIPVVAYRLLRCSADDAKVLRHLFETLATTLRSSAEQDAARSSLLGQLVAFSEFWESPSPSQNVMDARAQAAAITTGTYALQAYCTFTKDNSSACAPFAKYTGYAASPLAYEKDAFWNVAARPRGNASVLLLSGTLDPVTPHRHAQSLFTALNTTNKKLVAFEHAPHGTLWNTVSTNGTTCGVAVLASYVRSNGDLTRLDTSCVASAPAQLSFALEPRVVANWLNATAAYDGIFQSSAPNNTSTSGLKSALASPYKLAIIALCVLLGLALVLACVFVAKWRRARKQTARGSTFCVDDPAYDGYCS